MKMQLHTRACLLALITMGGAAAGWAQSETHRCRQADGSIAFQSTPCPLAQLAAPEPPRPAPAAEAPATVAAPEKPAAPPPRPAPPKPAAPERLVSTPAPVLIPAPLAATEPGAPDEFIKPSKRKRDVLELSAQLERCRADVPGFAEKSAAVYAAWTRRHAPVLAEYDKLLSAKVRAGRRGEITLPLRACTDEWLRELEPLARMPDPRYQSVEKTWQVFLGALMTGDRTMVQNCLAGRAQVRWKERVATITDEEMRRMGASVRGLKVQWGDDYEKEGMVADTGNRVMAIAFRNVNEEWKIVELGGAPAVGMPVTPPGAAPAAAAAAPVAPATRME